MRSRDNFIYTFMCLMIVNKYIIATDDINNVVNSNKKIIIIGAGAAGIAAASKLFENGFKNVTILEAENRIGGRLYTTKLGNYSVDLGGQWVHGQKNNVAFNLANPLGLLDPRNNINIQEKFFNSSDNLISSSIENYLKNFFDKYFTETNTIDVPSTTAKSYGDFIKQTYDKEFQNITEMMDHKAEILSYLEISKLNYESADSWNDVSIHDDRYIIRKGHQDIAWISTGYGKILDILMKRYPDPDKELPVANNTILNAEVTLIDYANTENGHPILVTIKDGRTFEADHIIVTVSLGVLKAQYKSLFTPPLPPEKIQTIETLGFGTAGKVFLLFQESFLGNENYNNTHFEFIWNNADRKIIQNDPERMWLLGVTGVWQVEHKPKLFEFYIPSKWSKVMETIPENRVYNQTIKLLEQFMGKQYKIPKPIAIIRTQWYTNPHFRGTYSYHSVQSDDQHTYPEALQKPITSENPKVLFAGEATSAHRFSTADGAIESGWTAAEILIKLYNTQLVKS
ncbi:spermine oxidase-like [Phymastichus coffea]|uniref:spermine oxidase-like n=1 Tax=Phymastichus coffea TaxID=108790 RepID=UPI00273C22E1|nr:spermine oxidase-like [Phymastichus coffea]